MFKKNTAVVGFGIGNFINTSTGATVITGTPVETRIIDGTGAALTNAATYNTNASQWEIDLDAADMNGDVIGLTFKLTDCLPISYTIKTVLGVPQTAIAATGDAMALVDDAITSTKYDESTAFPLTAVSSTLATATALATHDTDIKTEFGSFAVGSAAISKVADSVVIDTGGGATPNTVDDTYALDGNFYVITDDTDIDFKFVFNVGGNGIPTEISWNGYAQGNNTTYTVEMWNWTGTPAWQQVGTITGTSGTTIQDKTFTCTTDHVGTGANDGDVEVRFYSADGTDIGTDRILCSYAVVAESVGYSMGRIWVDTVNGVDGSVAYVNGVADNPCRTWANVVSLISSVGISDIQVINGSTITLGDSVAYNSFFGDNWTLALGSQTITGAHFSGAVVSGVGTGTGCEFHDCEIGTATIPAGSFHNCGFGGTFTSNSIGQYVLHNCFSMVAGTGSPEFVFTGEGDTTGINNRAWTGGATYVLDSDCTLSHEVLAGGGTTVTTGGGNVEIRGMTRSLTFTPSGAGTIQFVGITGNITLNAGTTTGTYNLFGVSSSVTDNSTGATVNDYTQSQTDQAAILADTNELQSDDIPTLIAGLEDITVADIIAGIADGSYDLQEMMRIMFAVLAGKSTGGGTTSIAFRDSGDTKNRVAATVDTDGNRTAITLIET